MFTGIVQELGKIKNITQKKNLKRFFIKSKLVKKELKLGSSVSINGVCLTVVDLKWDYFAVEAVAETLRTTNLSSLQAGDTVNLEPALLATGRLDGHFVTGHIDTQGTITKRQTVGQQEEIYIKIPLEFQALMVSKGSICIDGISLTIAAIRGDTFKVVIIPHTLKNTTLNQKQVNQLVNIEFDILGKYTLAKTNNLQFSDQSQLKAKLIEYSKFAFRANLN
ncbi:MAG: riboflavin synthase [Candidatus Margulisbacteria bacterium]|nr:riboflavin synthase [Candidatus Margulisiibacteriota bacterium]MBU1728691.1 riboflavin synthase [Candidatus Margulisiibacteriota bacterium]MBU1955142.1 riboflavin synthase [Candidatus Margulisiibacteriota bacterium]